MFLYWQQFGKLPYFCLFLLVLALLKVTIYQLFGVRFGRINPFTLRLYHLEIKDKLLVNSLQYSIWKRKLTVNGLSVLSEKEPKTSSDNNNSRDLSTPNQIPTWKRNLISKLLGLLDNFHVVFENSSYINFGVKLVTIDLGIKNNTVTGTVFIKSAKCNNKTIFSGGVVDVSIDLKFDSKFSMADICLDMKFRELTIPVEAIILKGNGMHNSMDLGKSPEVKPEQLTHEEMTTNCIDQINNALAKIHSCLSHFKKFSVSADNIMFEQIPINFHPALIGTSDHLQYQISISSFTVLGSRYLKKSPGYKLLFNHEDAPLKLSTTVSSLLFALNKKPLGCDEPAEVFNFCEIPSISLYGDTNLFSQRALENSKTSLSNTVLKLVGHISSPTVDFEIENLSMLKAFRENIQVFTSALENPTDDTCFPSDIQISPEKMEVQRSIATYFRNLLPYVEAKITVEDPVLVVSDGDELLVHKCSILSIQSKSSKYFLGSSSEKHMFYKLNNNIEMFDYSFDYQAKSIDFNHKIFSMDSIAVKSDLQILPHLQTGLDIYLGDLSIDFSDLRTLLALNKIIQKIDSQELQVEERYFRKLYEKFAVDLETHVKECSQAGNLHVVKELELDKLLFNGLPSHVNSIKLEVRNFVAILGARSVFMSQEVYSLMDTQSAEDLVNDKLRKICHKIGRINVMVFGHDTDWHKTVDSDDSSISTRGNSLNTFAYDDHGLDDSSSSTIVERVSIWTVKFSCNDIITIALSETGRKRHELIPKTILKLPNASISIYPSSDMEKKIIVSISTGRLQVLLSLMTTFLVISAIRTLKQTFAKDINLHHRKSWAKEHLVEFGKARKKSSQFVNKKKLLKMLQVKYNSEQMDAVIILPNGVKTRLETFSLKFTLSDLSNISLRGPYFRLCVESPLVPTLWIRMLTVSDFNVSIDLSLLDEQSEAESEQLENSEPLVVFESDLWHLTIPHRFEMHQIFDNISTTFKTVKQMVYSLRTLSAECVISPHVAKPVTLPRIKLRSKRWIFSVEDDPFEAELNMIFQIGLQEQRSRLEKYELFENAVANMSDEAAREGCNRSETFTSEYGTGERPPKDKKKSFELPRSKSENKLSDFENLDPKKKHKGSKVQGAKPSDYSIFPMLTTLHENVSESWIRRIKFHRQREKDEFAKNFEYLWGKLDLSIFTPDVNKKVLDFVSSPFLMNLIVEGVDIDVFRPSCGVKHIPDFICDVGKGVPKDTQYSIMIPMYLDAKFDEIRCHIKDYPLPFIHMPKLCSSQEKSKSMPAIHIRGNFFITEDMIQSEHELRTIFVPLVPSAIMEDKDSFYSLFVPRTLTSVKVYTDLKFELNSEETTSVTWGGSYQPAIQQIMQCFDNFSKPPIDPSRKVGFWDKIRNMFHARIEIKWNNSGSFEVALKGSKSPYMIGGEAAGFVVGFKENVTLGCNVTDDPKQFLSCSSDKIYFSIPNFFAKPLFSWAKSSDDFFFVPSQNDTNLGHYASYYYLLDMLDSKDISNDVQKMRNFYIEKTAINLSGGVTLNLGILFERLKPGSKDRTFEFRPHYDVRLCNPIYVKDRSKHDSYHGFRSDFIHMSFSLLSNNSNSYNTMQLTPGVFKIFFKWWKTFSGNLSVRHGTLFGPDQASPKFGFHLYTISYLADVSPLFISHIHRNFDPNKLFDSKTNQTEFIGLKAKTEHFVMDLHQRKEVLNEHKEELGITKKTSRLKFNEGDVSTFGIDIRTVDATFKKNIFMKERPDAVYNIFDNDMRWYDVTDFSELNFDSLENDVPKINIGPLLYSPKFVYRKKASYGDKYQIDMKTCEKVKPFDNSISHECVLHDHVRVPLYLIKKRLGVLEKENEKVDASLSSETDRQKISRLEAKNKKLNSAIQMVTELIEDITKMEDSLEKGYEVTDKGILLGLNYSIIDFLGRSNSANKIFENRFYIFSMLLKWNETTRDVVYRYIHLIDIHRAFSTTMDHRPMQKIEQLIDKSESSDCEESLEPIPESENEKILDTESNPSILNDDSKEYSETESNFFEKFEAEIKKIASGIDYVTHSNHIVQFVAPQIQLTTNQTPDSCILVTAPSVKLKILGFDSNTTDNEYNENIFMTRYAAALTKAKIFIFHEDNFEDYHELFFDPFGYGQPQKDSWQPWLGLELCFESEPLENEMLIKEFSTIFKYDKASAFASIPEANQVPVRDSITCDVPSVIISSNSRQYLALYNMFVNLLVYVEPRNAQIKKQIEKLILTYDSGNPAKLKRTLKDLKKNVSALSLIENELAFKRYLLDDVGISDLDTIRGHKTDSLVELYILMKVLNVGSAEHTADDEGLVWHLNTKEIILHMLHDDGKPFLDVALANSYFQRFESSYGFNSNKLVVGATQIFNLEENVIFNNLLGPLNKKRESCAEDPLIVLKWEMDRPIGGIKIIKNVETQMQGLEVNVEEETIKKIIQWVFPSGLETMIKSNQDDELRYSDTEDEHSEDESSSGSSDIQKFGKHSVSDVVADKFSSLPGIKEQNDGELDEMIRRSVDYMIIETMTIDSFMLSISYKGHGAKRLINVTNFVLVFPRLEFKNRTMTLIDLSMLFKRLLIKSLLRHTGRFIGNKLTSHASKSSTRNGSPLKQLSHYKSFTDAEELKE